MGRMATSDRRTVNGASDAASQTERAVLALREMLLRGDFAAGQRLTELALAARLGASRTPVRHALNRLAHEGLLEALPAGGFSVRQFTLADIWDAIEIRGALEGIAARLAAQRYREPARAVAAAGVLRRDGRPRCGQRSRTSSGFSRSTRRSMPSCGAWRAARCCCAASRRSRLSRSPRRGRWCSAKGSRPSEQRIRPVALEHHRSIVEAIEERDGARAESVAREHSRVARNNLMRARPDQERISRVRGGALIKFR